LYVSELLPQVYQIINHESCLTIVQVWAEMSKNTITFRN